MLTPPRSLFCRPQYEVNDDSDSVQMLQRSTQVGEFYRMAPPKSFKKKAGAAEDLPGQYMDIVIYDEEMDKHVHITVREALNAAMHSMKHKQGPLNGGFFGDQAYLKQKYAEAGITKTTLADVDDTDAGVDAKTIADAIENAKEWHPVEIIIARPFIEHLMMSAVIAVAGRDTGATLFGPADMQISANTSVKTIEGAHTDPKRTHQTCTQRVPSVHPSSSTTLTYSSPCVLRSLHLPVRKRRLTTRRSPMWHNRHAY